MTLNDIKELLYVSCPRKWFLKYTPIPWKFLLQILLNVVNPLILGWFFIFSSENTPMSTDLVSIISVILPFLKNCLCF